MSRTYKHIGKGCFNNGVPNMWVKKYLHLTRRKNREKSFFTCRKNSIINKINKRQDALDLNEHINNF